MAAVNEAEVLEHLLHQTPDAPPGSPERERIGRYVEMVRARAEGAHVAIDDPFDRAVALAFELVLDAGMDPWDIDLVRFSHLYLERVRRTAEIDLATAGRIVVMAWTILRMQSDALRVKSEPPPPEVEEAPGWDDLPAYVHDDPDFVYTQTVVGAPEAPIDEKIRHKGDRKVTLLELVEALEAARREAEARAEIVALRDAEKARRATASEGLVEGQVHKEDQEREVEEVWERILRLNGHPIPLDDIHSTSREDLVKALVSVLFLARANRVRLWQDNFPYGTIFVQNLAKLRPFAVPPDAAQSPPPPLLPSPVSVAEGPAGDSPSVSFERDAA